MIVALKTAEGIQRKGLLMKIPVVKKSCIKMNFKRWVGFREEEERMAVI